MKILQVIPSLNPVYGGTVESLKQLTAALEKIGHRVEVVTCDDRKSLWLKNLSFLVYPLGKGYTKYRYSFKLISWLKNNSFKYDLVIVNGIWQYSSLAVYLALKHKAVPYFVRPAGMLDVWFKIRYPLKHLKKMIYWFLAESWVLKAAGAVLFTNQEEKQRALACFKLSGVKIEIVNSNGTTVVSDKNKAEYRDLFFQRFPSLKGRRLILFLGRITPKKNCLSLIKAFKRCFFRDKRLLLLMVGPIDRSYKKKIAKEIKNSEIDKNMFWIDFLSEKERSGAYLASEVFILPSHQENFGMSVVEALAHSCPVLISDKVGIHQTVSFSKSGYVEPDTLKGCEKLLERWLSLAYNERCNMRIAAEKCFLDYFEINTVAEMFALRMAKFVEKE